MKDAIAALRTGIGLDPVEEAHAIDRIERWLTRGEDVRQSPPPSRNRLIVQHGDHVPQRVGHIAAQMLGDLGVGKDPILHFGKQAHLCKCPQEAS
jgi:hypothetical protein